MEAAPPKVDPPKRKRRWFQFSLRTLMIVVTLLAAQCAYVAWVVRDRQRLIQERDNVIQERDDALLRLNGPGVSYSRYQLAGEAVTIEVPAGTPPNAVAKVQRLYPDAKIKFAPRQQQYPYAPPSQAPTLP
jgi:hypothetical protein